MSRASSSPAASSAIWWMVYGPAGLRAAPDAAVVEDDRAVVLGELRHLEHPGRRVGGEPHDQQQRIAAAVLLVVQLESIRPWRCSCAWSLPERVVSCQLVAEVGMGEPDERASPLDVAEDREIGRAVLGDDPVHVVSRRGDAARRRPAAARWWRRAARGPWRSTEAQQALPARRLGRRPCTNDSAPPTPEYWRPPMWSAAT